VAECAHEGAAHAAGIPESGSLGDLIERCMTRLDRSPGDLQA
jgi:hypothetical protein